VAALQLAGEELQADVAGAQLFRELGQGQAAAEPLVLVNDQGDRDAGGAHLPCQGDGPLEFGAPRGAGRDHLGEDPGDSDGLEGVELGLQRLAYRCGAGVADLGVSGRRGVVGGAG